MRTPLLVRLAGRLTSRRDQYTVLFFAVLIVYAATASYLGQSVDTASTYYPAWQLAHHGNVTMDAFVDKPLWFIHAGDRVVSNRFPGAIWLATPLYLFDNGDSPSAAMGNLTGSAAAAGAVTVLFALLRRLVPTNVALLGTLLVAFGTPTWTVSADALWPHGPGQLWLLAGVLLCADASFLAAGLAFGAAILTRPHYAIVPAVVGLWLAATRRQPRVAVRIALGSGVGLGLLLLYDWVVFGTLVPSDGYAYGPIRLGLSAPWDYLERVLGTLVSPSRGVLVLTPFLLLLLPGLPSGWRASPDWARAAAAAGLGYMLVQLYLNRFSGGYAFFAYRLPLEWLTLSAPLLTLAYTTWTALRPARRVAFLALALYSVGTHAAGSVLFKGEHRDPGYWTTWNVAGVFARHPIAATALAAAAAAVGFGLSRMTRPVPASPAPASR